MMSIKAWTDLSTNQIIDGVIESSLINLNRRDFFKHFASSMCSVSIAGGIVLPNHANSAEITTQSTATVEQIEQNQRMIFREKPTAPIGALVPAIQQRLLLEATLDIFSTSSSVLNSLSTGEESGPLNKEKILKSIIPPPGLSNFTKRIQPRHTGIETIQFCKSVTW
jgi:hypothetical protein